MLRRLKKNVRVAWVNRNNPSHKGHGSFCLTFKVAIETAAQANADYPEIDHWVEFEDGTTYKIIPKRQPQLQIIGGKLGCSVVASPIFV